ncbi:MAG: LacI family DNA-binding transcriptional regulator, partial [Chloroflexota bacterium]
PTLQDVAKKAGVSTATVSKVLSNTPYVSEATRDKVLDAVSALEYRPNLAARALSSGKTTIVAVVFPYIYDTIFKDPLVMRVLEGVETVLTAEGYNILLSMPRISHTGDDAQADEHFVRLVQSGYIEGLIAIDNVEAFSFASFAEKHNVPAVVLGHHMGDYTVYSDNYAGGKLLMEQVLAEGHRQIGIISVALETNLAVQERMRGIQAVYQSAGIDEPLPIVESDFSSQGGAKAVTTLLAQAPHLTAIIAINDRMAIGALSGLQALGKRVPDDVSVVGYDNIPLAGVAQPQLTTIDQKPVDLGNAAATLLLRRLQGETPTNVVIDPVLIKRESLSTRR